MSREAGVKDGSVTPFTGFGSASPFRFTLFISEPVASSSSLVKMHFGANKRGEGGGPFGVIVEAELLATVL